MNAIDLPKIIAAHKPESLYMFGLLSII